MKETLAFLEARGHPIVGSGLAIVATSERQTGDSYGEGFLILPRASEPEYRHQLFALHTATRLEQSAIEGLLVNVVRTWLQGQLAALLLAWQERHPNAPFVPPYSLHAIGDHVSARLSILDTVGPQVLARVKKEARTRELQEYVTSIFDIAEYFRKIDVTDSCICGSTTACASRPKRQTRNPPSGRR